MARHKKMKREKYPTRKVRLIGANQKENAMQVLRNAPLDHEKPLEVIIREEKCKRTLEQSAKFHAMCGDVANQKQWVGKKLSLDQWKVLFVSGHTVATNGSSEIVPGIEGEFVNIRESTANMTLSRLSSLIEYVYAWGSENGIMWGTKEVSYAEIYENRFNR